MSNRISERHVKIMVALEQDEEGYPPATTESLWALDIGEGLYQIDNIPFFATDLAMEDLVSARPEHGALQYGELIRPSGHDSQGVTIEERQVMPHEIIASVEEEDHAKGLVIRFIRVERPCKLETLYDLRSQLRREASSLLREHSRGIKFHHRPPCTDWAFQEHPEDGLVECLADDIPRDDLQQLFEVEVLHITSRKGP